MQKSYHGTVEELKAAVTASGLSGHWVDEGEFLEFHADDGPALNFWPAKQLLMLQGAPARKRKFDELLSPHLRG